MAKFLVFALLAAVAAASLQHTEVMRQVDIRTHVEEVLTLATVKNTGKDAVSEYLITIPEDRAKHLSYVQAVVGAKGEDAKPAEERPTKKVNAPAGSKAPHGTVFYSVSFAQPLKADEETQVQFILAFTRVLVSYPAEIAQDAPHLVKYGGNAVLFTPYETVKQSAQVKLGSKTPAESLTKNAKIKQNGEDLELGPFENVESFSVEPLEVHFESAAAFATASSMLKEIEISHRGNVAVEDHYVLHNTAAKLKGGFSRYDYQRQQQVKGGSFRYITALLPAAATDIYYRDQIGNISTSHVREESEGLIMELHPRFPMFGGWKTDFYMGYNLPASTVLSNGGDGRYYLNISFASPFPQIAIDNLEVRIILPEYASNIEWTTPFDIDSESRDVRVTYLDLFGRPVLILRGSNLCRYHNRPFQVAYSFSSVMMYQEPFLLIAGFVAFFFAAMAYMRFELTIAPASGKRSLRSKRSGRVGELINKLIAAHNGLVSALDAGSRGSSDRLDKAWQQVQGALDELQKSGDAAVAAAAGRLEVAEVALKGAAKKYQKADNSTRESARAGYAAAQEDSQAKLNALAAL